MILDDLEDPPRSPDEERIHRERMAFWYDEIRELANAGVIDIVTDRFDERAFPLEPPVRGAPPVWVKIAFGVDKSEPRFPPEG